LSRIIRQRSETLNQVAVKQMTSAVNNLMESELEVVIIEHLEAPEEGAALIFFVKRVLTVPGALAGLSTEVVGRMRQFYRPLMEYAVATASELDAGAALQLSVALGELFMNCDAPEVSNFARALNALLKGPMAGSMQHSNVPGPGSQLIAIDKAVLGSALRFYGDPMTVARLQSVMTLPAFCTLYAAFIAIGDATAASETLRILSALAFGRPFLLPRVWRWLAMNAGLPLEVAAEAVAFDIPSLPDGIYSLPLGVRPPFALFCRVCLHYLAVADDVEFYEEQTVFSLAQIRAMATGLTAVVFRSFVTTTPGNERSSERHLKGSAKDTAQHAITAALRDAPRLVGALYDRDGRRQFCLPSVWLEPYSRLQRLSPDRSIIADIRAFLHENPERRPSSSYFSAEALLLVQAPQCIPFDKRLETFRALVSEDKLS
jgi:hypothetical protein